MERAMGPLPDRSKFVPPLIEILERADLEGEFTVERSSTTPTSTRAKSGPALFLAYTPGKDPEKPAEDKRAGILCLHQTTAIGKDEPRSSRGIRTCTTRSNCRSGAL